MLYNLLSRGLAMLAPELQAREVDFWEKALNKRLNLQSRHCIDLVCYWLCLAMPRLE